MASFSSNDIESALSRKGFRLDNGKHKYYFLFHNGVRTSIRTMVSHNHQDIGDNLQGCMASQMGINKKQFSCFVECSLTETGYKEILFLKNKLRA